MPSLEWFGVSLCSTKAKIAPNVAGAQNGSKKPATLHDFKLDALNMVILLEDDRRALRFDCAVAEQYNHTARSPRNL